MQSARCYDDEDDDDDDDFFDHLLGIKCIFYLHFYVSKHFMWTLWQIGVITGCSEIP